MKKQRSQKLTSARAVRGTVVARGGNSSSPSSSLTAVHSSFPLLVALDSLGGVTCTRLTLSSSASASQVPVSCSAKVVAAHISGSPRTVALSPCGNFLALGSSTSLVQVFALKVKDSPDHRFAVSLSLLTRIVFPFPSDHIFFAPLTPPLAFPREAWQLPTPRLPLSQYELLACSRAGDVGIHTLKDSSPSADKKTKVTEATVVAMEGKKRAFSSVRILHSALPHFTEEIDQLHVMLPPPASALSSLSPASPERALALCLLDEISGSLSLIHPTNGQQISLPKTATGIHSCSCVATYQGILACSSRCGRLSFYSTDTMELLHVIYPTAFKPSSSPSPYGSGSGSAAVSGSGSGSAYPVKSITFLHEGKRVVIHHQDNSLSLLELELSTKTSNPTAPTHSSTTQQPRRGSPKQKKHLLVSRFLRLRRQPTSDETETEREKEREEEEGETEVIPIANDNSMFAIRQRHLLTFFLITSPSSSVLSSGSGELQLQSVTRTATFSLQTHLSIFLPNSQSDLRSEDLTSKARLGRYLEANQPISVLPSRTLISRRGQELEVTVLGRIGTSSEGQQQGQREEWRQQQFVLAASLEYTSAIYTTPPPPSSFSSAFVSASQLQSPPALLLHTCCSLGSVRSSAVSILSASARGGVIAALDQQDTLRVLDCSLLHLTLRPLLLQLSVSAKSSLPSEREDLELWENLKTLREAQFISRELFAHEELMQRACLGTFRLRSGCSSKEQSQGQGRERYAMAISPRAQGDGAQEERGELSVFISVSNRHKNNSSSLYEVFL
jgi:hypothetical protein